MRISLEEATILALENRLNEVDDIKTANEKLHRLNSSEELIKLVSDYLYDNLDIGYPIYLISKKSGWMVYDGIIIDDNKAEFLVSDSMSKKIINIYSVYKYYEFSDKYR